MMLQVNVITADAETGRAEASRVIDHDNHDDRVWLGKHCYWAMRNGRSVTTHPVPEPSVASISSNRAA